MNTGFNLQGVMQKFFYADHVLRIEQLDVTLS